MTSNLLMDFSVDRENNKIKVRREFAAPIANVWAAWTQSDLLDQWWAPRPWKARTKTMDFREGGHWLYAMVGPEGEEHWARLDYKKITPLKAYHAIDAFCDEKGNISAELPSTDWQSKFSESANSTFVDVELTYDTLADLEQILELGFKEGFTMALGNLDELLR